MGTKFYYSGDPKDDRNYYRTCGKCGAYEIYNVFYNGHNHTSGCHFCPNCGEPIEKDVGYKVQKYNPAIH